MLCAFCNRAVDPDDPTNYRQVTSWVHGPKMDGPVLREQTGRVAHELCVQKVKDGIAPETEPLF